jgi:hypothetical protein
MNNPSSPLKAFKRAKSLELSKWYMGTLMTNLAETRDTNGAFLLVEGTAALALARGNTSCFSMARLAVGMVLPGAICPPGLALILIRSLTV